MSGKFDPRSFFDKADHVALAVEAAETFGWLNRSLDLPGQWAALVTKRTGEQHLCPAGGEVEGAGAESILFFRVSSLELAVDVEGLPCSDGIECRASVRLRLRLIAEEGEVRSFASRVLGSHRVARIEAVERYVEPAVRNALAELAAGKKADELMAEATTSEAASAVSDGLKGLCFSAGLALDAEPVVRFDSATLRDVRQTRQRAMRQQARHEADRQIAGALERAQSQHVEHLSSLLGRLKELAAASPDIELAELIRTFSEAQRGELYEALLSPAASSQGTQWIVVAAGDELLFFAPDGTEKPARRVMVNLGAGPVRSVQLQTDDAGRSSLWLGGATGVYRLALDESSPSMTFVVSDAQPVRGGFNSVAIAGDRVVASHSELGLREWRLNDPTLARPLFPTLTEQAKAVRHASHFDGELYASIDNRVIRWRPTGSGEKPDHVYEGSAATITAICPSHDGLFAGNSDGDILHWPAEVEGEPRRLHRGGGTQRAAESVWLTQSRGIKQLVFADTSLSVHARVLGDSYACRYEAGGQTLRRVEVAPDMLVATNDLRDRLVCWRHEDPTKPFRTIGVSRICRSTVQDVCLVPNS